ncbi:hypothetical protein GC169_12900 [bacterium]|nr:hypothetical protein [bacterium]
MNVRTILLVAASTLFATTSFADVPVRKTKDICTQAAAAQLTPAPTKVRVRIDDARLYGDTIRNVIQVTMADGTRAKAVCDVNKETAEVTVKLEDAAS